MPAQSDLSFTICGGGDAFLKHRIVDLPRVEDYS